MEALSEPLGRSPELFPVGLDVANDLLSFIRLRRADYDQASFLDARILTRHAVTQALPWARVAAAIDALGLQERCGYIFHIGHVGSTLLSRLIGAHPGALSIREPMVIRTFAELYEARAGEPRDGQRRRALDPRLSGCLKLLSRTFGEQQRPVVKVTSFVSELAAGLLSRPSAPCAMMMYVSPESYLATILGGPNSRQEAKILTPSRLRRLHRRIGREAWSRESLSEGESLALGWACEMSALAHAASSAGKRVLPVNFEQFLADPPAVLMAAFRHIVVDATPGEVHAILAGPDMRRYSKAPEYAYDAALRTEVLREARLSHGGEIRRGLDWLQRAASDFAPVRAAMDFAAAQSRAP
jgi:hypothetical protein